MTEINVNQSLAAILSNHHISFTLDNEFIYTAYPLKARFKATAHYFPVNDYISSRLDVTVITDDGETIIECFGDFGADVETAIKNNLKNFSLNSLHPLLASLGCDDQNILDQVALEEWEINGKRWVAYIGNISAKTNGENFTDIDPTNVFFDAFESGIKLQPMNNKLHWFRAYYLQHNNSIVAKEFLMDNENIINANELLVSIPVIPGIEYYSLRVFIVLRQLAD